jgi:hypothetical protein
MTQEQTEQRVKQVLKAISVEAVISGFWAYRDTYQKVLRSPRRFASQELLPWQPSVLQSAISVYLYGVAICFFMYVPLIQQHGLKLGKLDFLLQLVYLQLLLVCLIHLSAKVFRGCGTLSQTATAYSIWTGIVAPIVVALSYPLLFYRASADFIWKPSNPKPGSLPSWALWWTVVVFIGMFPMAFLTLSQWIADLHQITKRRLLLAMIIIYGPIMAIHNHFLSPFISSGLHLISAFLQKLL